MLVGRNGFLVGESGGGVHDFVPFLRDRLFFSKRARF
jgi:hypothetical protein